MVFHTFTRCNTTSAVYATAKTSFLKKKTVASDDIRDAMEVISDPWAKSFEVGDVGWGSCFLIYMVEQEIIT